MEETTSSRNFPPTPVEVSVGSRPAVRRSSVPWLEAAGVDGVQVNFYDFGPDLDRFARTVPPLLREAGLRISGPLDSDTGRTA